MRPVSMRPEKREPLLAMLRDHPDSYWWIDVLCARSDTPLDIMGDIYACCLECIAMIDCEPSLIPDIHAVSDVKNQVFVEYDRLLEASSVAKFESMQLGETKCSQLLKSLDTFFETAWWQRVWTWQEMALPQGGVRFMAETNMDRLPNNTITLDELLGFKRIIRVLLKRLNKLQSKSYYGTLHKTLLALFY